MNSLLNQRACFNTFTVFFKWIQFDEMKELGETESTKRIYNHQKIMFTSFPVSLFEQF